MAFSNIREQLDFSLSFLSSSVAVSSIHVGKGKQQRKGWPSSSTALIDLLFFLFLFLVLAARIVSTFQLFNCCSVLTLISVSSEEEDSGNSAQHSELANPSHALVRRSLLRQEKEGALAIAIAIAIQLAREEE